MKLFVKFRPARRHVKEDEGTKPVSGAAISAVATAVATVEETKTAADSSKAKSARMGAEEEAKKGFLGGKCAITKISE